MNSENKFLQITFAMVVVAAVIGYFAFQQGGQDNDQATSTDAVVATNCDVYNNDNSGSEFRPSYMPTFENRQALKQAMISYHGEDMEGKDGPLAAVGFDIALIYHEYKSYKCSNNGEVNNLELESMGNSDLKNDTNITIDATAVDSGSELEEALKNLGAESVSSYEHVVSASVPIEKIPELAALSEMRSVSLSRSTTNSSSGGAITN